MARFDSELGPYYFVGSSLSLLASLFLILSYRKFPRLRKHPSSIIFFRSCYDVVFNLFLVMLYAQVYINDNASCSLFAPVFQAALLGSQSYYFMLAIDLYSALRNPFTDGKSRVNTYHLYVLLTSGFTALVLVFADATEWREGMQVCWIESTDDTDSINVLNWALFFGPTIVYLVVSAAVWLYAFYAQTPTGTFEVRKQFLRVDSVYVLEFILYWLATGATYFSIWSYERDTKPSEIRTKDQPVRYTIFALLLSARGAVDVAVWTWNQGVVKAYRDWIDGKIIDDESEDMKQILRKKILIYSIQGSVKSVDLASEDAPLHEVSIDWFPPSLEPPRGIQTPQLKVVELTNTTEQQTPIRFVDYAPAIFRLLRAKFGILDADYRTSILKRASSASVSTVSAATAASMKESGSEGASGSFFYFTHDRRYILKTLFPEEAEVLLGFLPAYAQYMAENPDSLITRILGFHQVGEFYFFVMKNVLLTTKSIDEIYDLKGSWISRRTRRLPGRTWKDSDLHEKLSMQPEDRRRFLNQVRKDAEFLRANGLMDYSLLLGVHNLGDDSDVEADEAVAVRVNEVVMEDEEQGHDADNDPSLSGDQAVPLGRKPFYQRDEGGLICGNKLYYFGIIDLLQTWTTGKKSEHYAKTLIKCADKHGISAVNPNEYCERFIKGMEKYTTTIDAPDTAGSAATVSHDGSKMELLPLGGN